MRKIIFTSRKFAGNSFRMRGEQIYAELKRIGYDCELMEPYEAIQQSNCIIIWVRRMLIRRRILKENYKKNIIVYDPLDRISEVFKHPIYSYIHAFIFPYKSHWIVNDKRIKNKLKYTLYHHYDPRIIKRKYDKFTLGYFGYSTSADHTRNVITGINRYSSTREFHYDFFERISCHYNIRTLSKGFGWRPTTKIATAAGAGCNILTSRDSISEEILCSDYPYWINEDDSSNLEAVKKLIEKAKNDFGKARWNYGLECLKDVEKITNIEYSAKRYGKYLEEIDAKNGKLDTNI